MGETKMRFLTVTLRIWSGRNKKGASARGAEPGCCAWELRASLAAVAVASNTPGAVRPGLAVSAHGRANGGR